MTTEHSSCQAIDLKGKNRSEGTKKEFYRINIVKLNEIQVNTDSSTTFRK